MSAAFPALYSVAPRAGAGIEMIPAMCPYIGVRVAPRAGAGIEIWSIAPSTQRSAVAPRAGAGIEIEAQKQMLMLDVSPLAQGRELK